MRTIYGTDESGVAANRDAVTATIIAQFRAGLRELRCMSGDRMHRSELSFTHSHILSMLDRHGSMTMGHLAEMLDVSLSNASGVIDRLEERGLVERIRVPDDRRVVIVRPTELGRAALLRAEVFKDELVQAILVRLDGRRLKRLAAALEDVRDSAMEVFATDPVLGRHEHVSPSDHGHGVAEPATDRPPTPASAPPA